MVDSTDDAGAFYERSAGDLENGADFGGGLGASPALRPSALYVSTGLDSASVAAGQGGWLELDYGVSGNVTTMTVHAQCAQRPAAPACAPVLGGDPAATRQALRDACVCQSEQHYRYGWDELNRLVRARRYEREGGAGPWSLGARLRYRYDGANQRTVKEVQTEPDPMAPPQERIALYVFPGDYERRGLEHGAGFASASYVTPGGALSESQYLVAGARVVWKPGDPALGLDRDHRITLNLSDLLGTTSAVVDLVTGELTECSTYCPGGARETYLTTPDAELQPEPTGFTGKETDEEVGLVYFGQRYLIPRIARWASPDPLAIHALGGGEAMNSYHYVAGSLLQARDPKGLGVCASPEACQGRDQEMNDAAAASPRPDAVFVAFSGNTSPSATAGRRVAPRLMGTTGVVHDEVVSNSTASTNSRVYATDVARTVVSQAADFIEANVNATGPEQTTRVVIYGYSMGGVAALELVRELESRNIAVELLVTVDATTGLDPGDVDQAAFDRTVPENVSKATNYYQTQTSLMGSRGAPISRESGNSSSVVRNVQIANSSHSHADEDAAEALIPELLEAVNGSLTTGYVPPSVAYVPNGSSDAIRDVSNSSSGSF